MVDPRSGEPASDVRAVADELRRECAEDYVGLWQVAPSLAGGRMADAVPAELIVRVAAHLLGDGAILIGQFRDGVFEPWAGDAAGQLERLRDELRRLGRAPDIGEIGWFAARRAAA